MLNSIIKIDLHIHSELSSYKEDEKHRIVSDSTIENLPILFQKLEQFDVNLISFTDHNRFNLEMYCAARKIIEQCEYPIIKGILAGVEFDVKLEGKGKCHIIAIFDAQEEKDYKLIYDGINSHLLTSDNSSYTKDGFEELLKKISLDVLLIVHQKKDLNNHNSSHDSLNDSTEDPESYIEIGYINALEYQKPNVQGILLRCLSKYDGNVPLVSGSDCHTWSEYPNHSKLQRHKNFRHTEVKMLPTFRGLLLALTSPKTRFDRVITGNSNFIESIMVNNKEVKFDKGINVIIGENGAGKSSLLEIMSESTCGGYINDIKKINKIEVTKHINKERALIIKQAELITQFNENKGLFKGSKELFLAVDNTIFEQMIRRYHAAIIKIIKTNINKEKQREELKDVMVTLKNKSEGTYYIIVKENFNNMQTNNHLLRHNALRKIITDLEEEISNKYYEENEKTILKKTFEQLKELDTSVKLKSDLFKTEERIKSIITIKIKEYNVDIRKLSSSEDAERINYKNEKQRVISKVVNYINVVNETSDYPSFPPPQPGIKENLSCGFKFITTTKYNNVDLKNDFLKSMFVQNYANDCMIKGIKTRYSFAEAIRGVNVDAKEKEIIEQSEKNLIQFINNFEFVDNHIFEAGADQNIGNTLGEMSLVYYKYQTFNNDDWDVLVIDQPEDNVSNNKISKELIDYFNNLRLHSRKQIIFVTHNPLLVVNLDADNIIHLDMHNNMINVKYGCLEDEINHILDLVANTMDGGRMNIEKRLKVYGKDDSAIDG